MAVKKKYRNLNELLAGSTTPVLVDFYAEWCGPCKMMAKVLEEVNEDLSGRLKIVKIDTEKYPGLASQHNITALPTMVVFNGGKAVHRIEGLMGADELVDRLRPLIR
ncbi:thioredoxin [filamentous cyanobacterium LEGE 11480]|uniref:Thioredoxin n=1 Tax=Romeriopsis navalis LEGE 11480 TaxID=2777977 RepID=A0A928VIU1_9CYAN|nr:thioredoxin [Romeriopsis navalis]MBE9029391.1 thioredoxin [Romeriopsis navalis LEGE 11480]